MTKKKNHFLLNQLRQLSTVRSSNVQPFKVMTKSTEDVSRIIEMAWEDRTPFEAIKHQYELSESQVIELMRLNLHPKSFKLWRQRVNGRATKHQKLRSKDVNRAYCPTQYKHR